MQLFGIRLDRVELATRAATVAWRVYARSHCMLKATFVAVSAFETSCIQGIRNTPWVRQDEMP